MQIQPIITGVKYVLQKQSEPSVNPVPQVSPLKSWRYFQNHLGCSKILGISPGFLEDSQRISENALLLEIVRKEFQQVTGVFLVIIMDVGEEVVQPLAHINLRQFAALW